MIMNSSYTPLFHFYLLFFLSKSHRQAVGLAVFMLPKAFPRGRFLEEKEREKLLLTPCVWSGFAVTYSKEIL